jgi:predicted secreted protein
MSVASSSIIGYGSDFQRSTDGSSYATVGQVTDIVPPKSKATSINQTNLLSPSGSMEFRAGLRDGGTATFKILFKKTDFATLQTDYSTGTTRYWKVVFSDLASTASTLAFAGFIEELGTPMPMDDKVEAEVQIKVSGVVTFTSGT